MSKKRNVVPKVFKLLGHIVQGGKNYNELAMQIKANNLSPGKRSGISLNG